MLALGPQSEGCHSAVGLWSVMDGVTWEVDGQGNTWLHRWMLACVTFTAVSLEGPQL